MHFYIWSILQIPYFLKQSSLSALFQLMSSPGWSLLETSTYPALLCLYLVNSLPFLNNFPSSSSCPHPHTHLSYWLDLHHRPCLFHPMSPLLLWFYHLYPTSDHNSIMMEISLPSPHLSRKCTKRNIWLYHLADYAKAVRLHFSIQWINHFLLTVISPGKKDRFFAVINLCAPSKFISSSTCHNWIDNNLRKLVKKCQNHFLLILRNTISSTIKRNKHVFFQSLSSSPPKKFWSFVCSTRKRPSVPTL